VTELLSQQNAIVIGYRALRNVMRDSN